jgi:hypothetical protein
VELKFESSCCTLAPDAEQAANLQYLADILTGVKLLKDVEDSWCWIPNKVEGFSVRSCYASRLDEDKQVYMEQQMCQMVKLIWKSYVPSKVGVFIWRLLLQWFPTRKALLIAK